MTGVQILSLVLLLGCLVAAIWRHINMGALGLVACFILDLFSRTPAKVIYAAFPGNLVILIVGVTLLFGHLTASGAIETFVDWLYRRVGRRFFLIPWIGFALGAALSTIGALSTAPIALLVPIVARVSVREKAQFFTSELAVIIGANMAALSPLNPTGATVLTALSKSKMHYSTWGLWALSVTTGILAVLALQALSVIRMRRGASTGISPAESVFEPADGTPTRHLSVGYAWASAAGLLAFVLLVTVFGRDIGMTGVMISVLLQVIFRPDEQKLMRAVPWSAILLLSGLLTYLGLVQQVGTMQAIQDMLTRNVPATVIVFALAYLSALLCNIESSAIGVLTLIAPIVGATLGGTSHPLLVVAAVAIPACLTVMNPVHVAGTLIVGQTQESDQPKAMTRLLALSAALSLVVPGVYSAIAVLLG